MVFHSTFVPLSNAIIGASRFSSSLPGISCASSAHLIPTVSSRALGVGASHQLWQHPKQLMMEGAVSVGQSSLQIFGSTTALQRFGENLFAAAFIIAVVQAALALFQYRTNPVGELIVPPGSTWGVERPDSTSPVNNNGRMVTTPANVVLNGEMRRRGKGKSWGVPNDSSPDESAPFYGRVEKQTAPPSLGQQQSTYADILNRVNRWLFLLLPWAARQINYVLARNSHLFHIGFIMTLASWFDFPHSLFRRQRQPRFEMPMLEGGSSSDFLESINNRGNGDRPGGCQNIVVIGDSLAIGLGSVDVFDMEKNNTLPYMRIENFSESEVKLQLETSDEMSSGKEDGPIFPRVFAQTLSRRMDTPIYWRSAGVDGGTVSHIEHFCLDVIKEEVESGRTPDVVVIICGINDLKDFIANPFKGGSARQFRSKLTDLICDIQSIAPNAKVVLPALPVQMFHRHSPLNIFPLAIFLDTIVGFWDSQKKLVADSIPSPDVTYVGLSAADVYSWYNMDENADGENNREVYEEEEDPSLLAADGVHPNARCYALWAETMGSRLCDANALKIEQVSSKQRWGVGAGAQKA